MLYNSKKQNKKKLYWLYLCVLILSAAVICGHEKTNVSFGSVLCECMRSRGQNTKRYLMPALPPFCPPPTSPRPGSAPVMPPAYPRLPASNGRLCVPSLRAWHPLPEAQGSPLMEAIDGQRKAPLWNWGQAWAPRFFYSPLLGRPLRTACQQRRSKDRSSKVPLSVEMAARTMGIELRRGGRAAAENDRRVGKPKSWQS